MLCDDRKAVWLWENEFRRLAPLEDKQQKLLSTEDTLKQVREKDGHGQMTKT